MANVGRCYSAESEHIKQHIKGKQYLTNNSWLSIRITFAIVRNRTAMAHILLQGEINHGILSETIIARSCALESLWDNLRSLRMWISYVSFNRWWKSRSVIRHTGNHNWYTSLPIIKVSSHENVFLCSRLVLCEDIPSVIGGFHSQVLGTIP